MKMSTRIFSAILCLLMLAYVIPAGTFEVKAATSIKVGGVTLESGKYLAVGATKSTSTKPSANYAYYTDGLLKLYDFTFSGNAFGIYSTEALNVETSGTSTFTTNTYSSVWSDSSISFRGTGRLNLNASDATVVRAALSVGINGGVIYVTAKDRAAVHAGTGITAKGGAIIASNSSENSVTITTSGAMTVSGCNVQAINSGSGNALSITNSLTVTSGSVYASGCKNTVYVGSKVTISSGKITVIGKGTTPTPAFSIGDKLTISGGVIEASSEGSTAIRVSKNGINMTCGDVIVSKAKTEGILVAAGDVYVKDGGIQCNASNNGISAMTSTVSISGKTELEITAGLSAIVSSKFIVEDAEKILLQTTSSSVSVLKLTDGTSSAYSVASALAASASKNNNGSNPVAPKASDLNYYKYIYIRTPDVYVGGVGMTVGDYLAEGATVASTYSLSDNYAFVDLSGDKIEVTLKNFDLNCSSFDGISRDGSVYVRLMGTSTITTDENGIYAGGNTGFYGSGTLKITSTGGYGIESESGSYYHDGGNVYIDSYDNGISTDSSNIVKITSGTLEVISRGNGISTKNVEVVNATVTLRSGSSFRAISVLDGLTTSLEVTASTGYKGVLGAYDSSKLSTYKAIKIASHACKTSFHSRTSATCTTSGKKAYYTCSSCGGYFEDNLATKPVTDFNTWVVIPATGHTPSETWKSNGVYHWHSCTVCFVNQITTTVEEHTYGSDNVCDVCEYVNTVKVPADVNISDVEGTTLVDGEYCAVIKEGESITLKPTYKLVMDKSLYNGKTPLVGSVNVKWQIMGEVDGETVVTDEFINSSLSFDKDIHKVINSSRVGTYVIRMTVTNTLSYDVNEDGETDYSEASLYIALIVEENPNLAKKISGSVKTYGSDGIIKVYLMQNGETVKTLLFNGNEIQYEFSNVPKGEYVIVVEKNNNVCQETKVTVGDEDVSVNVETALIGDVNNNGAIDSTDYLRVKGHFIGTYTLEGIALLAGDVNKNGAIDSTDYLRIKGHFLGTYTIEG